MPVTVLTDSRVLFYLFSSKVHNSSVKIRRWCLKLISDYPNVTLHFVKSGQNLADFLTRSGLPEGDLNKFNVKNVKISDFTTPKPTYTVKEWIEFVEAHPHYLTVNEPEVKKIVNVIHRGLENIESVTKPISILQSRLARSEFVKYQKKEFEDLYLNCLASDNFTFVSNEKTYRLLNDLLIMANGDFKIMVPPTLIGPLLAYTHLLGHKGLPKMLQDLEPYYFENLYSITKSFVTSCYSCFLSYTGNKKQKIGVYPIPNGPMNELTADLAENLNVSRGFSHLLLVKCLFSDYCLIFPLKTKTSTEVSKILLYSVCQHFNVKKIHTDNGSAFRSKDFLSELSALGIKMVNTSALHPAGRGSIERFVQTVKVLLKKIVATRPTFDWQLIPFIISKTINNTKSMKTGFEPATMVFGKSSEATFLELEKFAPPNFLVLNNAEYIKQISEEIQKSTKVATEAILQLKLTNNEKINEKRVTKSFSPGDIVFVVDNAKVEGNSRTLKTKLSPSPYVVIKSLWTTTIVRRIADSFTTLYHNSIIKKYDHTSPYFATLPAEVTHVLLHKFSDFLDKDFNINTLHDPLDRNMGIKLFDESQPENSENEKDLEMLENEYIPVSEPEPTSDVVQSSDDSDSSDDEVDVLPLRSGKKRVTFS